jgi:hypothetical protein
LSDHSIFTVIFLVLESDKSVFWRFKVSLGRLGALCLENVRQAMGKLIRPLNGGVDANHAARLLRWPVGEMSIYTTLQSRLSGFLRGCHAEFSRKGRVISTSPGIEKLLVLTGRAICAENRLSVFFHFYRVFDALLRHFLDFIASRISLSVPALS